MEGEKLRRKITELKEIIKTSKEHEKKRGITNVLGICIKKTNLKTTNLTLIEDISLCFYGIKYLYIYNT